MIKLLIVFLHLLAVCTAIGAIVATDLRVIRKLAAPPLRARLRLAPPNEYVMQLVAGSLAVLYVTGGALLWLGHQDNAQFFDNPKLQAKLLLVALLTLNAVWLHARTFPWLTTAKRVASWRFADRLGVAAPVAASNSLWMFCAFLGIARPWNFVVPLQNVLALAAGLFLVSLAGLMAALAYAGRERAHPAAPVSRRSAGRSTSPSAHREPREHRAPGAMGVVRVS